MASGTLWLTIHPERLSDFASNGSNSVSIARYPEVKVVGLSPITFLSEGWGWLCSYPEIGILARKSKKKKAEGKEQHKQSQRAKKLKKKQKKTIELPKRHRKGK